MKKSIEEQVQLLVEQLGLEPHPEGGYFKEMYRSEAFIKRAHLPNQFEGDRNFCTSIYFLLTSDNFSAFHRIKQDEVWHFYAGSPLTVHVIDQEGNYTPHRIGWDPENDIFPQFTVPANQWFASSVDDTDAYALVGCTVAPGFDFNDFELATFDALRKEYPEHQEVIRKLTRL